jgi:hypothetical protein
MEEKKISEKPNNEKMKEYQKEWRKKNTEKIRLQRKEYYKNNKEKVLAYTKSWREKNPEKVKIYVEKIKDKYKNDPEFRSKQKEAFKKWYEKNKGGKPSQNTCKDSNVVPATSQ